MTERSPEPRACRSCGAPILWALTVNGKRLPLDALPVKRIVLSADGIAEVRDTYMSHFATCPNADQHRRKT